MPRICILAIISAVNKQVTKRSQQNVIRCRGGKASKVFGVFKQTQSKLSKAQALINRRTHTWNRKKCKFLTKTLKHKVRNETHFVNPFYVCTLVKSFIGSIISEDCLPSKTLFPSKHFGYRRRQLRKDMGVRTMNKRNWYDPNILKTNDAAQEIGVERWMNHDPSFAEFGVHK